MNFANYFWNLLTCFFRKSSWSISDSYLCWSWQIIYCWY